MNSVLSKLSRAPEVVRCLATVKNSWRVAKAYVFRQNNVYPLTVHFRNGTSLTTEDWDELTTVWHVCFGDEYYIPKDARTIVDLGANIGAFAVWASSQRPAASFFSVEPFPSTFSRLTQHVEKNQLQKRVTCVQAAVSSLDGSVRFDATVGKRSYCRTILAGEVDVPAVEVPSYRLKTFLDQFGIDRVDCLKMDVEGAEYDILLSAEPETLKRVSCLTMEYHDNARAEALWSHLNASGFKRIRFTPGDWSGLATFVQ